MDRTREDLLSDYPYLEADDINAVLESAARGDHCQIADAKAFADTRTMYRLRTINLHRHHTAFEHPPVSRAHNPTRTSRYESSLLGAESSIASSLYSPNFEWPRRTDLCYR